MKAHVVEYQVFGDDLQFVEVELDPGETRLQGFLRDAQGRTRGPYYVQIRRLPERPATP